MFTANVLSTTAPAKQVGESSLETGDLQTLPSLLKLSLILRDACHPHALHRHKVRCPDQCELSHSKVDTCAGSTLGR